MRLFIDSANLDHIREIKKWGVLSGVTTNPTLIAREGRDLRSVIEEIASVVDGPISVEVVSTDAADMIREGREYARWSDNVVIKCPLTPEGLEATAALAADDIPVNVTLVFTANQALLAARAGAAYVSPFVGRLDDISHDGMKVVRDIADIFHLHDVDTEIIAASIRHPQHVTEAALAGADIATCPYDVLKKMVAHPLTDAGLARFLADWKAAQRKGS